MLVQYIVDFDEFVWQGGQCVQVFYDVVLVLWMWLFVDVFSGQVWMVCDLGCLLGKQVCLLVEGESIQVDWDVLEKFEVLFIYLLCNVVDYGIEVLEICFVVGKLVEGRIIICVCYYVGMLVLELSDDGGGIDLQCLCEIVFNCQFVIVEIVV